MRIEVVITHQGSTPRSRIARRFRLDSPSVPSALKDLGEILYHGQHGGMETRIMDAGSEGPAEYCHSCDGECRISGT